MISAAFERGRREDVSLLRFERGLPCWKLISSVFLRRKEKFLFRTEIHFGLIGMMNGMKLVYHVKEYVLIIELIELIFRYSLKIKYIDHWIIK